MYRRPKLRVPCRLLLLAFATLHGPHLILAQTNVGKILGVVHDPSGAVVPNATVTARGVSTGVETEARTNGQGAYIFPSLSIGEYALTIRATGFKTIERPGVQIVGSETVKIDFQLELGQATQTVQVAGEAPKVDTTTTTTGTTLTSSEITDLPLLLNGGGRNALNFIGTLPGVIGGPSAGTVTTINGGPEGGIGYYLDGVLGASAGHTLTGDSFNAPPEAIAELRLNATNDSEYGANSGVGITAITKSGTNELHGDVFEYLRNKVLNARSWAASQADPSKQNEYGFTLGGPLVLPKIYNGKNKTFFFVVYSGFAFRTAAGGTVLTVPTAKMRGGDFSEWLATGRQIYDPYNVVADGSGGFVRVPFPGNIIPQATRPESSVSSYYQSLFPNRPGIVNNWIEQLAPSKTDTQKGSVKIDHNFNGGRQRLSFYHDHSRFDTVSPGNWTGALATGLAFSNYAFRVRANWQATLGANKVFSLRVALNRNYFGGIVAPNQAATNGGPAAGYTKNVYSTYTPLVNIPDLGSFGIAPFAGTDNNTQTIIPGNADLSWSEGNHNAKFGFSYANNTLVSQDCFTCASNVNFGGRTGIGVPGAQNLGQGYADFYWGAPSVMVVVSPLYTKYMLQEYGIYGQDSWRVTPKLTLDYGLRLDLALPPREAHDRISFMDPNIPNPGAAGLLGARSFFGTGTGRNGMHAVVDMQHPLAPHFGFAYQVRPKTVVRGSYGTSSVNLLGLFESGVQLALGGGAQGFNFTSVFVNQPAGITSTPYSWDGGFPLAAPPLPNLSPSISNNGFGATWQPHGFKSGRSQNISFGVEQELPHSLLVRVGYVGNLSHGLPVASLLQLDNLNPKYTSLGNLLTQNVTSPAAQAQGIKVPYPGFVGTVARALTQYPQFTGAADIAANIGFSLYHSLQASVQKRYGDLSFLLSYTLSKQLNNYTNFSGLGEGYSFSTIQNAAYLHQYKTLANLDRPQTVVLSWVYQLPFGPGKRFVKTKSPVLGQVVGGWRLSAIHTYQSGSIIAVSTSQGIPGFGPIWANRLLGGCGNYDPNNPVMNSYLNLAAFADPAPFAIGNTQVLPNVRQCANFDEDVSLQKAFKIHERLGLEIAADAQNIFNRHAWTGLATNIDSPGFGRYSGTTGPRLMQLHVKLEF